MYRFDTHSSRKQKPGNTTTDQTEFLVLASEPVKHDYMPGSHLSFHYRNRYLAKRRVMRTIQRLKHEQR